MAPLLRGDILELFNVAWGPSRGEHPPAGWRGFTTRPVPRGASRGLARCKRLIEITSAFQGCNDELGVIGKRVGHSSPSNDDTSKYRKTLHGTNTTTSACTAAWRAEVWKPSVPANAPVDWADRRQAPTSRRLWARARDGLPTCVVVACIGGPTCYAPDTICFPTSDPRRPDSVFGCAAIMAHVRTPA